MYVIQSGLSVKEFSFCRVGCLAVGGSEFYDFILVLVQDCLFRGSVPLRAFPLLFLYSFFVFLFNDTPLGYYSFNCWTYEPLGLPMLAGFILLGGF